MNLIQQTWTTGLIDAVVDVFDLPPSSGSFLRPSESFTQVEAVHESSSRAKVEPKVFQPVGVCRQQQVWLHSESRKTTNSVNICRNQADFHNQPC